MTSVCKDPGNRKRIMFTGKDNKRSAIRLGKMDIKDTKSIATRPPRRCLSHLTVRLQLAKDCQPRRKKIVMGR